MKIYFLEICIEPNYEIIQFNQIFLYGEKEEISIKNLF